MEETKLVKMADEQDHMSRRDGNAVQTRLDATALPPSILKILRPIVDPPSPVTANDLEEFWHDFRVEWLLLQTQSFKDYFLNSEELRYNQKDGDSWRNKRLYTELALIFGPYEGLSSIQWSNSVTSRPKFLNWLLERCQKNPSLVKRTFPFSANDQCLLPASLLPQVLAIPYSPRTGLSRIK